ncbi:MAG: DUF3971 domain-containing protein [Pseudorhodobacter sp.]
MGPMTAGAQEKSSKVDGDAPAKAAVIPPVATRRRKTRSLWRMPLIVVPLLFLLAILALLGGLAATGRPVPLPVWAVAEVETRMNRALVAATGQQEAAAVLSLGGVVLRVDQDLIPRLLLEDLRLLRGDGEPVAVIPEARFSFDLESALDGRLRLRTMRLVGPRFLLRRQQDGRFDIALGPGMTARPVQGFAGLIDATVAAFQHRALSQLSRIDAEAMTFTFDDRQAGRIWEMGDGRLTLANRPGDLALQMGVSLQGGGTGAARADLTLVANKADSAARMTATVDGVAAADIAAQAPPLTFLSVLDAPISGQISSALDSAGGFSELEATLSLGSGALRPTEATPAVPFDTAQMVLGYEPEHERLDLRELNVQSAALSLRASGHADLPGARTGLPRELLGQIDIAALTIDPEGLFEAPVNLEQGAIDLRIRLDPFTVDIGQIALIADDQPIRARGRVAARPDGWAVAMDLAAGQVAHDRLLALWPARLAPRARKWVADNVIQGEVFNARGALRLRPGKAPDLMLGYEYRGADVQYLKTLPPIRDGQGHAVIEGRSYTMVMPRGKIAARTGGTVDIAGSVFHVANIRQKPAQADISLQLDGSLTSVLSLLDEPPFQFLQKSGQPVKLGEGHARAQVKLRMPLRKGVKLPDVKLRVTGAVTGFRSEVLAQGRLIASDHLALTATNAGMEITGQGLLQDVPFDITYSKLFTPEEKGRSRIDGRITLSRANTEKLGIALPEGLVSGQGPAQVSLALNRGEAPKLHLSSTLEGLGMAIPALGWSKGQGGTGNLEMDVTLGKPASVERLDLQAAGFSAKGTISLAADGALERARFSSLKLGGWLDAEAELQGRGKGRAPAVAVTGGRIDIRGLPRRPQRGSSGTQSPLQLALDELAVTDAIRLTGFRATLAPGQGGISGEFTGRVNGGVPVRGTLVPAPNGSAVRIRSNDAGGVFSSARIFPNARGGSFDLMLNPLPGRGEYDGSLKMTNISIRNMPVLAEILSAVSIVGLLEQMGGSGLLFSEADATFRLTPDAIRITSGAAMGASMGVSLDGIYYNNGGRLNMQGVISPIYLLNGIGSILTRRGEGLFGFNYSVTGTTKDPDVSVNPLSILTPGMFRDIFRSPPPGPTPRRTPEPEG